jgi:hypothetical protein
LHLCAATVQKIYLVISAAALFPNPITPASSADSVCI